MPPEKDEIECREHPWGLLRFNRRAASANLKRNRIRQLQEADPPGSQSDRFLQSADVDLSVQNAARTARRIASPGIMGYS